MRIEIPEFALIALIGATSSGKTSFAHKHFLSTEVHSSDFFRALVSDDENDQGATRDAFDLLYYAANKRLDNMKTTVIDATNVQSESRKQIIELAKKQNVHAVAIVFNLSEDLLKQRNAARPERGYPERVIHKHVGDLRRSLKFLKKEGFRFVYVLNTEEEVNEVEIVRTKMWNNRKDEHGPFDVIGDIHGCYDELVLLLEKLGYVADGSGGMSHPEGRKAVFLGDFCDRGPRNVDVLKLAMNMVNSGNAMSVCGNHDTKLFRYLRGNNVQITHGLEVTVTELEKESLEFKEQAKLFLDKLVSHYVLDDGNLVVAHAGIKQSYIGRGSMAVKEFCLYGETTGETDEFGMPVRLDWAADYRGRAAIVYGHTPQLEVQSMNNTFCIDTGCVFGGKLTAFRYPEKEFVEVPAAREYYAPAKPLVPEQTGCDDMLVASDVLGKMRIDTKLMPSIMIYEDNSAAAFEIMSRFAADPHWLIYLPPTMSPCETSSLDGYLEYPTEAFDYYRSHGIQNVVCEKKHMGSRSVIVLCRDAEVARRRFGVSDGSQGIIYTRTGRHFFDKPEVELEILARLAKVLDKSNFWDDFGTDWVCLDAELMPWSEKAQELLKRQYAPVGRAGRESLAAAVAVLEKTCERENSPFDVDATSSGQNIEPKELLKRYKEKTLALDGYVAAYREYSWKVTGTDDLKIAPFHLLACEGHVFSNEKHVWHMETLKKYCTGIDPIFIPTDYITVDTADEAGVQHGIEWWKNLTGSGGEGMVVKPETYVAKRQAELLQPAVKCRGVEYLRIIYGPEYLAPEHMQRLKKRSLARKRSLALREFSLGLEALHRFVAKEPLYRVHECVFGVLAFESEPVDPRL